MSPWKLSICLYYLDCLSPSIAAQPAFALPFGTGWLSPLQGGLRPLPCTHVTLPPRFPRFFLGGGQAALLPEAELPPRQPLQASPDLCFSIYCFVQKALPFQMLTFLFTSFLPIMNARILLIGVPAADLPCLAAKKTAWLLSAIIILSSVSSICPTIIYC